MPDRTTRLTVPVLVVAGVAAVGLGVGWTQKQTPPVTPAAGPVSPSVSTTAPSLGLVRLDYRFERQEGHASNQVAVWVEDATGRHVRTLSATSFTAEGGYDRRPMSLPAWREVAGWDDPPDALVQAVSRPAPQSGDQALYWDGLDASGVPVPPGSYRFRVEGNLLWENRVLFTGTVALGDAAATAEAAPEFQPAEAASMGGMVDRVRAEFLPGQRLDPALVTTYTRGS